MSPEPKQQTSKGTAKKTISLPQRMLFKAMTKMDQLDYPSFSDYIQGLIRADLAGQHDVHSP